MVAAKRECRQKQNLESGWVESDVCEQLHDLFYYAPDAYIVTDINGIIRQANRVAGIFLATPEALLPGRDLASFVAEEDRSLYQTRLGQLQQFEFLHDWEIRIKPVQDKLLRASVNVAHGPAQESGSAVLHWLIRDISERKRIEETLRKAHLELEDRLKERNAELAKANQELRLEMTEHERADEKIIQQNDFLNHVLESLTHPFYVLDVNDYTIKMANSAAAVGELTEHTTCYALTHRRNTPCDGKEHACPLQMVKKTRKPVTVEHIHFDKDGNPRNMEVHGYPIFDEQGNVVQMIEYSLDITDRKKMEEALRSNAEKIKLFAYAVSHDLKSPIIGINGLTRLLHKQYRDRLNSKGKMYCDQILKASEHAVALIEEINFYVRTKETPLTFEPVNIEEILQMVQGEFHALLAMRHIEWSEPESIGEIKADKMSLVRVLRNLVDNALKYGGDGLRHITIGYTQSEEYHTISVSDDGVGVEQEDCEKIFGLFQRNHASKGVEGTGLGLAIVREIAEKHRGRVWAEPGAEKGVTFYISISKVL